MHNKSLQPLKRHCKVTIILFSSHNNIVLLLKGEKRGIEFEKGEKQEYFNCFPEIFKAKFFKIFRFSLETLWLYFHTLQGDPKRYPRNPLHILSSSSLLDENGQLQSLDFRHLLCRNDNFSHLSGDILQIKIMFLGSLLALLIPMANLRSIAWPFLL